MIVINPPAVDAALRAFYGQRTDGNPLRSHSDYAITHMQSAIEAALPHLTDAGLALAEVRTCKVCGCSDAEACIGGCYWAQPGICSTCAARQHEVEQQYLSTLRAVQAAAEQVSEQARRLGDENAEVAQMQREDLAGATWRTALQLAATVNGGSPTQDESLRTQLLADAQWFVHHLGNPPVTF